MWSGSKKGGVCDVNERHKEKSGRAVLKYVLLFVQEHKGLSVCVRVVENKVEGAGQRRKTVMEHRNKQRKKRGGGGKSIGLVPMFAQDTCGAEYDGVGHGASW